MPNPTQVPDETVLRKFLLGDLPPGELEAVGRYLDAHPEVSASLGALAASDPLLSALHAVPAQSAIETPALTGLVTRISELAGKLQPPATPNPGDNGLTTVGVTPEASPDETTGPDTMLAGLLTPPQAAGEIGRFAEFRVIRELGRGGMGIVFEAQDAKLGRRVALKVMAAALAANPTAKKRFLQEATSAAAVEHDHIVPIWHIGEDARGLPYLVMPLLTGENLEDRLKSGRPLATVDVLTIGRQIADGLAAAHAAGLIHRDIKPSNIWLEATRNAERGTRNVDGSPSPQSAFPIPHSTFRRVRILDFGLARSVRVRSENLTHSGAIMGTPSYMAPEQARGLAVDHRADLFSLGAVLYQMTTGRRPFTGSDTFAVLTALATETPPPPISVNPRTPPELSDLIVRLLAKDADERRPQTAMEVVNELAKIAASPFREGEAPAETSYATQTHSPARQEPRPPVGIKRRRALLAIAALLFLGLAALAVANGPTIVRVVNNEGELVVEVDDDGIEVVVKGTTVEILDPKGKRYLVSAGKDGEVEIREKGTDNVLVVEKFRVKRGDKVVVSVSNEKLASARKPKEMVKPPLVVNPVPLPRLPVGAAPPAKDAFPGELVFTETFEDPHTTAVFRGRRDDAEFLVRGGAYRITAEKPPPSFHYPTALGPAVPDVAIATRVRVTGGPVLIALRPRWAPERRRWLSLVLFVDGTWVLHGANKDLVDGKWMNRNHEVLKESKVADPALANGQWVNIAFQSSGDEYEVWLNGQSVARGIVAFEGVPGTFGVHIDVEARDGESLKLEIDYAAVWKLPPTLKLPLGDTPPPKDTFTGNLVYFDTFDGPGNGRSELFTTPQMKTSVRDGVFVTEFPAAQERPTKTRQGVGPPVADVALVSRARATNLALHFQFRIREGAARKTWLSFRVHPDGTWELRRDEFLFREKEKAWQYRVAARLKLSEVADPELVAGRWFTLSIRSAGPDTEVWVNGRPLTRVTEADPQGDLPIGPDAVRVAAGFTSPDACAFELDYLAAWDLAAHQPPAKDRFPGEVVYFDTFDDPKASKLPQTPDGPILATVQNGHYVMSAAALKPTQPLGVTVPLPPKEPGDPDGAFATRIHRDQGQFTFTFRGRSGHERTWWIVLFVTPGGEWSVWRDSQKPVNGKWQFEPKVLLAKSEKPDPELAAGNWINVAARWTEADFEIWANGRPLAAGAVKDPEDVRATHRYPRVQFSLQVDRESPVRMSLDYLAVWVVPAAGADPDRKAAEYVLSVGGTVRVNGRDRDIKDVADLPPERFAITWVWLRGNKQVTDDGLAAFAGCKRVGLLDLVGTPVTDAGLAHFKDCKELTVLDVVGTDVGDAGLAHFAGCKQLRSLWLGGTKVTNDGLAAFKECKGLNHLDVADTEVTDAGMAHFAGCKHLIVVCLPGTQLTDAGLAHFTGCKNLTHVYLGKTGITPDGVERVKKAFPHCRIEWGDGNVIEPKK